MNIAQSVASAMEFIIRNKLSNPNLKLSNILFNQLWDVKLTDQDYRDFNSIIGKPVLPVDENNLMFQYGLLLFSLLTEKPATYYKDSDSDSIAEYLPEGCPRKLKNLILQCTSAGSRPTFAELSNNTALFDDIFFEASIISADLCIALWENMGSNAIKWEAFLPQLCCALKIPFDDLTPNTLEFLCLQQMFDVDNNNGNVTDTTFGRLIKCIGPFVEGTEIIDQVKALLEMPWFSGTMSASEAEQIIQALPNPNRAFLVRFSSNTGEYSITFKQKNQILHSRVPVTAKYNLHQYVKLLQQRKKFADNPPSKFKSIFDNNPIPNQHFKYIFIR